MTVAPRAPLDRTPPVAGPEMVSPALLDEWARPTGTPTILVADDDDDIRDVIEFRLQVAGYRTLTADNGRSALRIAREHHPRLAILDVAMPGMDGLGVCYELHAHPQTAEIPVLLLSARCRPADVDLGFTIGADDYLTKPFNVGDMLRRVHWLLLATGR